MAVKVFCVTLMQEQWGLFRVLQQIIFFAVLVLQTKIEVFALLLNKRGAGPFMVKHLGIKPQEAQHSDCIVLWGINATATDVHILHDVNIAKKNGARVWIIDTHKTYTFSQAHEHIYVKPGSDGALALGMLHIIHRDGLADTDFIKEHVQGYDELVKEVLLNFTPEKASDICGVSVDRMTEFAHAYATSKAPFIRLGSGLSRYGNGAMTCRAINALPAVVGAWQ